MLASYGSLAFSLPILVTTTLCHGLGSKGVKTHSSKPNDLSLILRTHVVKSRETGAGEADGSVLGALVALPEDLGTIPSKHKDKLTHV